MSTRLRACVAALAVVAGCTGNLAVPPAHAPASAVRAASRSVYAWGKNSAGQLGDGNRSDSYVPVAVVPVAGTTATTGGGAHSLAIAANGRVWAWGWNKFGELGDGTATGPQLCPQTPCSTVPVQTKLLANVILIAAGDLHSLALRRDGSLWAWGANQYGQLGIGKTTTTGCMCIDVPQHVALSNVIALAGGGYHTLALRRDGTVWAWGDNTDGQVGDGTTTNRSSPVQVAGLSGVVAISGGFYHSLAITHDGSLYAWGRNLFGQLGNGSTVSSSFPIRVNSLAHVARVSGGGEFTMATLSDGTLWMWGDNDYGQLGDGSLIRSLIPVHLSTPSNVTAIGAGHHHALAADSSGSLWAWGLNADGELGNGTTTNSDVPVRVPGISGQTTVGAGEFYSLGY